MWFIGVEVEQETSGSAPVVYSSVIDINQIDVIIFAINIPSG